MDDFLENYEVVGRRLRPALGGTTLSGPEKLKVLRSAIEGEGDFRDDNRKRIKEIEKEEMGKGRTKLREEKVKIISEEEQKWDVETILSKFVHCTSSRSCLTASSYPHKYRKPPGIDPRPYTKDQNGARTSTSASAARGRQRRRFWI